MALRGSESKGSSLKRSKQGESNSIGCPSELNIAERSPRGSGSDGNEISLQALAELLSCPECGLFLHQPISLPCGHCLCLSCLNKQRTRRTRKLSSASANATCPTDPKQCQNEKSKDAPSSIPGPVEGNSDANYDPKSNVSKNDTPVIEEPKGKCLRCQASYPLTPCDNWSFPINILLVQTAQRLLELHPALAQLQKGWWTRRGTARVLPWLRWRAPPSCPLPVCEEPRPAPCDLCAPRQRPAQNYCDTCRLHYCAHCLHKLHGNPAFRVHTLAEPVCREGRELCPTSGHSDRALTHVCLTDGTLGCLECLCDPDGAHGNHHIEPLSEARAGAETSLRQALEHASVVQQQCDVDCEQMEALLECVYTSGAELRRTIRQGFLSLRNALLDQEDALLERLEALSSSTGHVAQGFLQRAGPQRGSLTGLQQLGQEALLEARASVFVQGARDLARWLGVISGQVPRPDVHLLPAGLQPFEGAYLHFDKLLYDMQKLMGEHLHWEVTETNSMLNAVAVETIGEEKAEGEGSEELDKAGGEQKELLAGSSAHDVGASTSSSSLGSGADTEPQTLEEQLAMGMPAGDATQEGKALLLPRAPLIYQHRAYGTTVEVFWMVPMGEDVTSFDVHFQDASVGVVSGRGVVMGGVKGCSLQTSGLRQDAQYLFRARSVNMHGHGPWSSAYRVITGCQQEEQSAAPATKA